MTARINALLDRLDTEDDEEVRADLIDEAIELTEMDEACAQIWNDYTGAGR